MTDAAAPEAARRERMSVVRRPAQVLAVAAVALVIADLFRWGNRWYVSTMFEPGSLYSVDLTIAAHTALVRALVLACVAAVAAVVGWRLRVVRA